MRIIKVESCEQCPYAYHVWANQYFCREPSSESKTIPNGRKIPGWCRLAEQIDVNACISKNVPRQIGITGPVEQVN